jgi:Leucine-rich repeat (LRR) protein
MTIQELHKDLIEAYTVSNLNRISLTLLNLFKSQQYSVLQKISDIISEFIIIKIADNGKGFSKFMMLYHPDRAGFHIREINKLNEQNNFEGLIEYSHILRLERIEEIATSLNSYEDIDYAPVYEWDLNTEGFSIININEPSEPHKVKTHTKLIGYTFYEAIKLREYGDLDVDFLPLYLEEIEEFELSSSDLNDLDGVQYCIHARSIDVSNNRITDLSPLIGLKELEELNLSDNQVGIIDELSFLKNLKSVHLTNNYIDDISPLFELKDLEYVELSGNNVNGDQINKLTDAGVTVDYETERLRD